MGLSSDKLKTKSPPLLNKGGKSAETKMEKIKEKAQRE